MARSYDQLGIVAQERGDLAAAADWHHQALAIAEALGDRPAVAGIYHKLGNLAQDGGDLAAAENWYRQSLAIKEALGDPLGLALGYGRLGLLAEVQGHPGAALDWTVRCIALFAEFPHPATGPKPKHLARLTAQLGMSALEASWRRCTGSELHSHVRSGISKMIADEQT